MATLQRLARPGAYDVLALTSAIWFLAKFTRYAFPPLFETFQREYGVSPATLGLLFTLLMLVYAGMQFPSGAMADRLGSVRVVTGGVLVLAVGAFGLAVTQSFPVLVGAMLLVGLGTGVHKTVAVTLLARTYPDRLGRTLGTMDAIGGLGGVVAPGAVLLALSMTVGWPGLFLVIGAASVLLAVAFVRRAPSREAAGDDGDPSGEGSATVREYLAVLRVPRVAGFVLVIVAYSFAFNGLVAFLPLFLSAGKGLSAGTTGGLYAALFAVSLVQPLTGGLSDRFGRFALMVGTLGTASVALGALLLDVPLVVVALLVVLIGLGGHGFRPVREAHLMDVLPAGVGGGSLGVVRTVMMGVGAISPAVVGLLAEVSSYATAFLGLAAAFGTGAVIATALALADRRWPAPDRLRE